MKHYYEYSVTYRSVEKGRVTKVRYAETNMERRDFEDYIVLLYRLIDCNVRQELTKEQYEKSIDNESN